MSTIVEPQKEIPVLFEADVIVVGGGPAGIGSALAAARNGAETILIEQFAHLGGLQTLCVNPNFSYVDPEIQGGIVQDIIDGLRRGGAIISDTSAKTRTPGTWAVCFESEYYKYLLDNMMAEAGVKLLYHTFGVGTVKEGNTLKGIFIESLQGRHAVLGKVVIDCTGSADIVWKSGAPCMADGFPREPGKGRHGGFGYAFRMRGVNGDRFNKFRKEHWDDWACMDASGGPCGREFVKKAKAEGKLYGNRTFFLLRALGSGMGQLMSGHYSLPLDHHGWMIEDLTAGEIDMRKQAWSAWNLVKDNIPGFENSYIDQTPTILQRRDTHRMLGEYVLAEEDVRQGKAFDDSIAISNMQPDVYGPNPGQHECIRNVMPYDIPYRCLVSKETDNLLAAGMIISTDFIASNAIRETTPGVCTGQAAGTAAALAVKNKVTPKKLNVNLLQETLRKQGARTTIKDVPKTVLEEYQKRAKVAWASPW